MQVCNQKIQEVGEKYTIGGHVLTECHHVGTPACGVR